MSNFLRGVNGVPRTFAESGSPTVYLQAIDVVSLITSGTNITLPAAGTYSGDELIVTLNGSFLDPAFDYNYVGAGPSRTQITMTFDLVIGDRIDFKKYRN